MKELKKEKFSTSIIYLFFSQIFIKILGLIYSLYLINKSEFGDEGNAIYIGGYQVFVLMLTFSSIGVPNAVSNSVAKSNNYSEIKRIFNSSIFIYVSIACISSIILFCFSNLISKNIVGIEFVSNNLKLLAPIIIITTVESIYIGFFNGIKQMKITAKIQFFEQLIKTIFTIGIVEYLSRRTDNPYILSVGATFAVAVSIIFSLLLCFIEKRHVEIYLKNFGNNNLSYKVIIKKLLNFSIPISVGAMLVGITKNIDSYAIMNILAGKIGEKNAQKIYGIIASKVDVLIAFPMAFNIIFSTALIPNISEARKNKEILKIGELAEGAIFLSLIIGSWATMGLFFFSENIFLLLFKNANKGQILLKIASISVIFSILSQTFAGILQGLQKNKIPVLASVIGTVVKVIFNIILVRKEFFLEKGIIISTIISNFIVFLILYIELKKVINVRIKKYFFILLRISIFMIIIIKIIYVFGEFLKLKNDINFIISAFVGFIISCLEIKMICKRLKIKLF